LDNGDLQKTSCFCILGANMRGLESRMRGLEERAFFAQENRREERVTFVYEDGTQKTMKYHDAIMEVLKNDFCQPKITESDQPPNSFIWAMITGSRQE